MYNKFFSEVVKIAFEKSNETLNQTQIKPNPFYIGFGNPNSKLLIVGQEKAIDKNNEKQIEAESFKNPYQWKKMINEKIDNVDYKFYNDYHFKNPLHPYDGIPTRGNTWLHYQRLVDLFFPQGTIKRNNSFLLNSFITEVNHEVSPKQLRYIPNKEREIVSKHKFYKSFKITILACGNYLKPIEIEDHFNVQFFEDVSESRKKIVIYLNKQEKRILINTRQMSNDVSLDYLKNISLIVKKYTL